MASQELDMKGSGNNAAVVVLPRRFVGVGSRHPLRRDETSVLLYKKSVLERLNVSPTKVQTRDVMSSS